ncbi:MAG: GAF domain-containing protein [Chloroflexota bacterium]
MSSALSPNLIETLQLIAWLLALIQLILSLYVLGLNRQNSAHRMVSLFLAILAINTFALGTLTGAQNADQARLPTVLLAITIPNIQAVLLLASLTLLKPEIFGSQPQAAQPAPHNQEHKQPAWALWILRFLWLAVLLPVALVLFDAWLAPLLGITPSGAGGPLWFSGPPADYARGYLAQASYTQGILSTYLVILYFAILGISNLLVLLYLSLFDRNITPIARRLARILFIANLVSAGAGQPFLDVIQPIPFLMGNLLFVLFYSYAIFRAMSDYAIFTPQDRPQDSLQVRLTWLALAIALPLLAGMGLFLTDQARKELQNDANQSLATLNQSVYDSSWSWLKSQEDLAKSLAGLDTIRSMQAGQQQSPLDAILAALPNAYMAITLDEQGRVVAAGRSTRPGISSTVGSAVTDQNWFQAVIGGQTVTYQPLIQRDIWLPDLLLAAPIQNEQGETSGVVLLASSLAQINAQLQGLPLGTQGIAYVVDDQNRLVAHSTWNKPEQRQNFSLQDLSNYPPVVALRQASGSSEPHGGGHFDFVDDSQQNWQSHLSQMPNGWGIIVQIPQSQLLAPIQDYRRISWIVLGIGVALLLVLTWVSIYQSLLPVRRLTVAAATIAAGEIDQPPVLEGDDELGLLGHAFNSMTSQLRQLITGLERGVAERTESLERRASQIQVAAEVARQASAARHLDELLQNVVQLITERFGHYHTGIFLISTSGAGSPTSFGGGAEVPSQSAGDQTSGAPGEPGTALGGARSSYSTVPILGSYAVLQAASSPGGKRMLARNHRLKVGETGIVGFVAATGQPRIALDVGADAVFFNNPDLPETRSEMAIPLRARGRVIGVLDVQSIQEAAFGDEDIEIMLVLADQLAVAIDNLRLLEQSQAAMRELERSYGQQVRQRWKERLAGRTIAFKYDGGSIRPAETDAASTSMQPGTADCTRLELPIELRGQHLGKLVLQKQPGSGEGRSDRALVSSEHDDTSTWSQEEINLAQQTLAQLALALENARLLEEIQQSASQEALINQVLSKAQSSLDLETVLQIVVQEIGYSIGASKVQLRLGSHPMQSASDSQADQPASLQDQERNPKAGNGSRLNPRGVL